MPTVFDAYPKDVIIYHRPESSLSLSGPGPMAALRDRLRRLGVEPIEVTVTSLSDMPAVPRDLRHLDNLPLVAHEGTVVRARDRVDLSVMLNNL